MTQDEIYEMAIQAELNLYVNDLTEKRYIEVIEAFAKLVAAKAFQDGYEKGIAAFNEAVELEREACAKVADGFIGGDVIAERIRARGEA